MKAGKLTHVIRIVKIDQSGIDDFGNPITEKVPLATLRAEIVQQSTEEFIRAYGASDETIMIFRTRFINGVNNSCLIEFNGRTFNIKETSEIGRREGLEIRCLEKS
ncbi:phage head closure protein [Bartonella sp. M0177]|jgi:phage head-tail adaptor, putative, SPP1 family|uniref:phage head closure protein n=1 Tax=Bartonella TaxID=773 RepID=UPI0018DB9165|nr:MULTISPECIES: phage head closure protein [Bartonella]MBH9974489.1 phage head closure protein [Bartonella choladocola]MBI0002765.1 phage head closure protein [Bartonella sp. M0177]MBI0014096.1 phage head closure protein [Bartonella sp. B10834G3]